MTQAALKTYFSNSTTGQSGATSFSATGSQDVAVGDLIFVIGRFSVGGTRTYSDNLSNTWTNIDANGLRAYCRVTTAGTLTSITMSWSSGNTPNAIILAAIFEGKFDTSPLDKNPFTSSDTSTPYTCPASGTLSKATELVIASFWYGGFNGSTLTADSPLTKVAQVEAGTELGACMGYVKTNATTTITPSFSTNIGVSSGTVATNSFKFTPRRRGLNCVSS